MLSPSVRRNCVLGVLRRSDAIYTIRWALCFADVRSGRLTLRLQPTWHGEFRFSNILQSARYSVTPYRSIVQDHGKPPFFLRLMLFVTRCRYIKLIQTHSYLAKLNFMQIHCQKYLCGTVLSGLLGEVDLSKRWRPANNNMLWLAPDCPPAPRDQILCPISSLPLHLQSSLVYWSPHTVFSRPGYLPYLSSGIWAGSPTGRLRKHQRWRLLLISKRSKRREFD